MSEVNYFLIATRLKARFPSSAGNLDIEDLWSLPLTSTTGKANLNDIAKSLHNQLNESREPVFVESARAAPVDKKLEAAFNVVIEIIKIREAENKAAADARAKAEQKQKILTILAERSDQALTQKTDDELKALLASL